MKNLGRIQAIVICLSVVIGTNSAFAESPKIVPIQSSVASVDSNTSANSTDLAEFWYGTVFFCPGLAESAADQAVNPVDGQTIQIDCSMDASMWFNHSFSSYMYQPCQSNGKVGIELEGTIYVHEVARYDEYAGEWHFIQLSNNFLNVIIHTDTNEDWTVSANIAYIFFDSGMVVGGADWKIEGPDFTAQLDFSKANGVTSPPLPHCS